VIRKRPKSPPDPVERHCVWGRPRSLWVRTSNRVVCGVMVNTSGGCRGMGGCPYRSVSVRPHGDGGPTEEIGWRIADSKPFGTKNDLVPSAAGT